MADDDEQDDGFAVDDSKKSERKRQRERQRRSDLASAFDELSSLISQIDPDESESANNKRKRRKSGGDAAEDVDNAGMTRLDLIGRTAEVIRKLQQENIELRQRLEELRPTGSDDKEVLVMVPTLSPADHDRGSMTNRSAAYPPYYPFPTHHAPIDYRAPHPPHDYYGSRGPSQHHTYQPYPRHPQQSWPGHPSAPPQPQLQPVHVPTGQYPSGQPPPQHLSGHAFGATNHPNSPQRPHSHPAYDLTHQNPEV